ncbi:MAG: histidinol-phosphatase HisJ family protein [Eubacterium sp.]|nr:histidinol-phosphatase HisJ family protein [Candidatus Colimonas fimequi]
MSKCLIDCDFHTHTGFSDDCYVEFDTMIEGAIAAGIKTLAVTDHYDPGYPDPEFPFTLEFDEYHKTLNEARERYEGIIDIRKGMEIGIWGGMFDEKTSNLQEADRAVNANDHDYIIGSFHCMRKDDLYRYDFSKADGPAELEDFYKFMYESLSEYKNFDVMGHFSIIDRYIGKIYDYSPVEDTIDEILKMLIADGKGIEINTSSFKYGTGIWLPRESILKRYLDLGGEILTFGSDAHEPKYYQYHFNDAIELAKSIGFKYYCTFKDRKPEFHNMPE